MRLLLLAAALVAASAAFSLGGFFAKDESMHLHPLSPPETDPRTARAKRQAYQVFVDGDTSVTVDKSGQAETGAWGAWTADQPCSRECGGGVQTEKRQCSGDCTGPSVRYLSCNTEPCPGAGDFRAEQCAKHNDEALDGNYHKWIPYKGKNKCELLCKPENGNFYYKWEEKVVDGTKCDAKSDDICVDGVCLPLGCDGKLGSAKKADKCGVCDGDGSTCKTIEGFFDERNLSPGYHDIIKLPEGATSIKISEARPSGNNLALKNASDHYYLNGNSMIQVEKEVDAAGTVFEYDDSKQESIVAKGPLTEEVTVALLFRKGNKDSAIKYEFSIPLMDVENMYKPGEWSACSVSCGKGVQTRMPYCIDVKSGGRVHDELCDNVNATKPESEKSCETVDCEAEWFTGEWEDCSATCGEAGQQWRTVYCHQMFADGKRIIVDDGNCTAERPTYNQPCNRFACPEWQAGPWSACSEKCGDAFQYRSVTCRSEKEGEEGKLLPADACPADGDLETQRTCNLGPCEGLTFQTTEWKLCEKCNDTEETREVTCKDTTGRAYPLEKCLVDNTTEIPIDTRSCATVQPCVYEWTTSQWSKCSTECGHGHKTRKVVCSIHQLGDIEIVDEAHCQGEKPDEKEECTNEEKCTGTWYSGPWSECSAECDGGSQSRMTVCLNYDKKPVPEWCDEASQPAEEQECNVDACPTCFDSDFGCCPDNSTFATGEFFAGCSNCSETIFGCCADNVTEATGADSLGCPEYEAPLTEETTEAPADEEEKKDGEEMLESADAVVQEIKEEGSGEAPTECEVTNEEGETAIVECPISNMTMPEEDGELIANATEPEPLHCSKTEFGCCPDWFTPATGKDNEGCEAFVLGACNGTQFGCCPDEVTMARGANLEGCGEPSCAASLYGCCKDRKTIAFGPHYAGCERSSFPCELSDFGCCPDGETAALGKNGTGCGENCLTTKFGCCPDGITVARGVHNEGCGCEFSQFGCCPDGKSVAKGVSFFGCPESCAQSKFGCCPDGKTAARGQNKEGCPCQYTRFGCCPDGETTALGPRKEGCDDCRYAKYGCCLDGETKATGKDYQGCPTTTLPPFIVGGTVAPSKIAACAQPQDNGEVCAPGYKLNWYFDTKSGRCEQFWFGGCKGNENRFASKEMCEQICVEPPGKGRCYLPKNNGGEHCNQPVPRYWYDPSTKQCAAFWYRGCGGNANSFANWEDCSTFCKDVEPVTEAPATAAPMPQQQPQQPVEYAPHNIQQQPQPEEAQVIAHEIPDDRQQAPQQPQQPQPQQPVRQTMEEICRQTQDSGPCQSYSDQWFFDAYKGECSTFIYGGCGGNLNRFRNKEECEQRCQQYAVGGARPTGPAPQHTAQPVAQPQAQPVQPAQPMQQQPMHPAHPAQPAQPAQQQPYPYPYPQQQPAAPAPARGGGFVSSKSRESCNLPQDIGRCKGSFDSWYHDAASGQCTQFKYSGCGGNANRFHSKAECEGLCVSRAPAAHHQPLVGLAAAGHMAAPANGAAGANAVCDEAKDTGTCSDFSTKWFYNNADGTCTRFHYGGCGGTGNRFDTEGDCKAACQNHQDACSLPMVAGPCNGKTTYFYYNQASGACESFVFGGCLGNTNRFATIEECQARCGPSPSLPFDSNAPQLLLPMGSMDETSADVETIGGRHERCEQPKVVGKCKAAIVAFYFDTSAGQCASFYYGGCGGNENRFDTREECERYCPADGTEKSQNLVLLDEQIVEEEEAESVEEDSLPQYQSDMPRPHGPRPLGEMMALFPATEQKTFGEDNEVNESDDVRVVEKEEEEEGKEEEPVQKSQNLEMQSVEQAGLSAPVSDLPELCLLPEQIGTCFDKEMLRWRYSQEDGGCVSFQYTGCDKNANHFTSEEACERACGRFRDSRVCEQPMEKGSCELAVAKWYHDSETRECRLMMWSGCGGNGNRFSSKEECVDLCSAEFSPPTQPQPEQPLEQDVAAVAPATPAVCSLAPSAGPCDDAVTMWHYDVSHAACRPFTFGGCRGNGNRFVSKEACEESCSSQMEALRYMDTLAVCRLPFETGPCRAAHTRFYYDFATGSCRQFTYGGCEGNANNFPSSSLCMSACARIGGVVPIRESFSARAHAEGPFQAGSQIRLSCDSHGLTPIVWYKNGALVEMSNNVEESLDLTRLTIHSSAPADGGEYRCAVGEDGIMSDAVNVIVNEAAQSSISPTCVDGGSSQTCALIVRTNLCGKKRYGTYCCKSCALAGFKTD